MAFYYKILNEISDHKYLKEIFKENYENNILNCHLKCKNVLLTIQFIPLIENFY